MNDEFEEAKRLWNNFGGTCSNKTSENKNAGTGSSHWKTSKNVAVSSSELGSRANVSTSVEITHDLYSATIE